MWTGLLLVAGVGLSAAADAAPIRSGPRWAIHRQTVPADWQSLVRAGNLASGRLVRAEPAPNDWNTGSDLKCLTDGALAGAEGRMWSDKRAVGWAYQDFARLTLDLGQSRPLGELVLRLQVINKDNTLPKTITVALSDDGEGYAPLGALAAKTRPGDDPERTYEPLPTDPPGIYAVVLRLERQARFVRLDFALHGTAVCDELAVTPAAAAVRPLPPAPRDPREVLDYVFDRRDQFRRLSAPGNLVLGKELRYAPQPNDSLTTDPRDAWDLTDGQFGQRTDEKIWFEKGAVGWRATPLATVFADLGGPQPIDSVVARFLGGAEQGCLNFPTEVRVLLSLDGKDYYLAASRHKRGPDDLSAGTYDLPEEKRAWVHNFVLPVKRKARYVAVQAYSQLQYFCSDELAVVRGADDLPLLAPDPAARTTIVTRGVAFAPVWGRLPVCRNLPLKARLMIQDARSGADHEKPCQIVLDLPDTLRFVAPKQTPAEVEHQGRKFRRYRVTWGGEGTEFYLQSLLPEGRTDVLYAYGDSGQGPENERQITWESLAIPKARVPKRLHVSLSWADAPALHATWPDYLGAMRHLGFNALGAMPCYWRESDVASHQAVLAQARQAGFQIITIESPAGAVEGDRNEPETKSPLPGGKTGSVCPAYRGQFYRKEHASFARHAVWIKPDLIFYDIEAYWNGSQEAPACSRCLERFKAGNYRGWDEFHAAMGREIHADMKAAIDKALAAAGVRANIVYGSYRTEPVTPLNDGLFAFGNLYPELLHMAMPSLYVAGNQRAVAEGVAANRARMQTNDIIPWLSTGCYGDYDPRHTRDMILEALANGARGVTYYWYGHFDAAHFKYHAEAVDIAAPVEDLFMDGRPLDGLRCSHGQVKLCGMGLEGESAVLVSNYAGLAPGTTVTVRAPAPAGTPVWDLHGGRRIGETDAQGAFTVPLGDAAAHLYYLGSKRAAAVPRSHSNERSSP